MLLLSAFLVAHGSFQDPSFNPGANPLLMQHPTMNKTKIVFSFAGDLWSVAREGGNAVRLTSAPGSEFDPIFSPDGSTIAFTGQYDGNTDVFTVPVDGGVPKRLTYHPAPDVALGWAPDGKSVLFASSMRSATDYAQLYTVSVNGGVPKAIPLPSGSTGCYSPDGTKLAYNPGGKWEEGWKRYRGGQASKIWIANLSDSRVKEIPRGDENHDDPIWVGNKIFFLDDKRGPVGLWSYDTGSGKVSEEIKGEGFDLKSASAGPDGIVYEKLGSIHIFNPQTHDEHPVSIQIHGDFPEVRPQFKSVASDIDGVGLSPSGQRAVFSARGWVFTVPASKGDARTVGNQQGVHRRDPAWSPDGKTIAFITDEKGVQQLALVDANSGATKLLNLGDTVRYYYSPVWSPDSTKLVYSDHARTAWIVDVASGKNTKVDKTIFIDPRASINPDWSPDSKWLTYVKDTESHMKVVMLYSLETGKATQVTDGLADAENAIFDRDGKHLYFTASTYVGEAASWLDLSSYNNPNILSSVYAIVLSKDGPNPLQPQSDEEPVKTAGAGGPPPGPGPGAAAGGAAAASKVRVDLENIEDRIITVPLPTGVYGGLVAGPPGSFFAMQRGIRATPFSPGMGVTMIKFSFATRKPMPFAQGVIGAAVSADGSKMLLSGGMGYSIVSTIAPAGPGEGLIDTSGMRVKIDPKAEWKQMFEEVWRNEPMLLYAPNLHGIDAAAMARRYAPFLANVASRSDLNYLFTDMTGEISIGHMWARGGDIPGVRGVPGGLLGCDFAFENGHYRLTRVYNGERWNPGLYAPLAQPGVNAKAGEYLLAIDGSNLLDSNDIYETLEGKAGKQVKLKIGPTPDGVGSREVVVVPTPSENALRNRAWTEDNRRRVAEATGGRIGYVHVPDTNVGGWVEFTRYYFAQIGKGGVIVDERFNHGGLINDYMVDVMGKTLDGYFLPRYGKEWPTPGAAIYGPKVMLANEMSGSGGDMFPWLFKHRKLGPVIGKRTWGGLVAAQAFPLVDGGSVNSPDIAFYNPFNGTWDVEGHGVDPDIDVAIDPYLWRQTGKDSQLEKAIEVILEKLRNTPPLPNKKPAYPDKSKVSGG